MMKPWIFQWGIVQQAGFDKQNVDQSNTSGMYPVPLLKSLNSRCSCKHGIPRVTRSNIPRDFTRISVQEKKDVPGRRGQHGSVQEARNNHPPQQKNTPPPPPLIHFR